LWNKWETSILNRPERREGKSTMSDFGSAALVGLCIGFLWGTGCSLAILYSIYLGGYRKAVQDSLLPEKSKRWRETLKRVEERVAKAEANPVRK
jgi:hypothetical protein